jgi:hypothetical protein
MRSAGCRTLQAGSLRSPEEYFPTQFSRRNSSAEIENGHAHRQPIRDLIENDAL